MSKDKIIVRTLCEKCYKELLPHRGKLKGEAFVTNGTFVCDYCEEPQPKWSKRCHLFK